MCFKHQHVVNKPNPCIKHEYQAKGIAFPSLQRGVKQFEILTTFTVFFRECFTQNCQNDEKEP